MSEPKFEVPAELRNLAQRSIEQAEKAFDIFFLAANKSWHRLLIEGSIALRHSMLCSAPTLCRKVYSAG